MHNLILFSAPRKNGYCIVVDDVNIKQEKKQLRFYISRRKRWCRCVLKSETDYTKQFYKYVQKVSHWLTPTKVDVNVQKETYDIVARVTSALIC